MTLSHNKQIMKKVALISLTIVAIASSLTYLYFMTIDRDDSQLIPETNNIDNDQQKAVVEDEQMPASNTKPQITKLASLNGDCSKGVSGIPTGLLFEVKTKDNYSASFAAFSCVLSDKTYIVGGEGQFWSHDFNVIHFDKSGNLLNTFSKDDDNISGGEFEVSDVSNGIFSISHRIIDPCYDATFTFTFDLNTGKYTENMKGGDDAKCWEKLNVSGGV